MLDEPIHIPLWIRLAATVIAAVAGVAYLVMGIAPLFQMLMTTEDDDDADASVVSRRGSRPYAAVDGRRNLAGVSTLPSEDARLDRRPAASFCTPAAKGFNRDRTVGCDQVAAPERRRWTHPTKPWWSDQ